MLLQGNVYATELCYTCPHNEDEPTEMIVLTPITLFPGLRCIQNLIAASMQMKREKAWEISSRAVMLGTVR